MKRMLFAIAALLVGVGVSSATDVDRRNRGGHIIAKAPATYNWSGVYIGLNGGAGIGTTGASSSPLSVLVPNDPADRVKGYMLGGQVGVRQQVGMWVFGVEADIDWTNISNRATSGNIVRRTFGPIQLADTATSQTNGATIDWLSMVTANMGVAWNRVLWSLKGGLAFGKVSWDNQQNVSTTPLSPAGVAFCGAGVISCPNGSGAATESKIKYGWTVGTVVEVAIDQRWSLKGEVDYIDLGSVGGATGAQRFNLVVTKLGANLRF